MSDSNPGPPVASDLSAARSEIERLDRELVRLIGMRLRVATVVAAAKRAEGVSLFDPGQEARVVRRATEWAREDALPEEDVRALFWRLIAITRRVQAERT